MKKNLSLIIMLLFLFNSKIKAVTYETPLEIISGGLSSGNNSPCGKQSGYVACYSPRFQFRLTLIDQNGNKVKTTNSNGEIIYTNSVDFSYSTNWNTYIYDKTDLEKKGVKLINDEKKIYKYKYSDIIQDENNKYNDYSKFKYIEIKMVEKEMKEYRTGLTDNPDSYNTFYSDFLERIQGDENGRPTDIYFETTNQESYKNTEQGDFISVFLYHAGFIEEKKNIEEINEKSLEIANNNYFLLIEPTYTIYYNTEPDSNIFYYRYGTGTEILEWLESEGTTKNSKYNAGYLAGLSANFVYQAGCNLYTIPNVFEMKEDEEFVVKNPTICSLENGIGKTLNAAKLPSRDDRLKIINDILNKSSGYTASTLQLKKMFGGDDQNENVELKVDLCGTNDGLMSLNLDYQLDGNKSANVLLIDEYKIGNGQGNSSVYCYDNVNYDFREVMQAFQNKNFKTPSTIKIPETTVKISRRCRFAGNQIAEEEAKKINYNEYINLKISELDDGESTIALKQSEVSIDRTDKRNFAGKGWINYEITLTYRYTNEKGDNEYTLLSNKNYNGNGYISVDVENIGEMFGYSNNMVKELLNGSKTKTIDDINYTYSLKYLDGDNPSESLKCKFNYDVDSEGINESLQFRVISLSNPFPARDGTSRLPGTNWLDAKNYVYDYIDNNRGVQYKLGKIKENTKEFKENGKADPNAIYTNTEPMYVIDLDAKTMKKIREYNKDHTYTDIKLTCNNGRQCISDFLRNTEYIPKDKLTGVCSNKDDYNKVLVNYNGITEERLRKVIYGGGFYQKRYDINKNLRNDTDDLEIFFNKNKNTFFYTCADKTFLSGG